MELKDRQSTYLGRVKLRDTNTGVETTYDVTLADGANGEEGTPINKQTLQQFKEDVIAETIAFCKGEKGEKGDKGDNGDGNYIIRAVVVEAL